MVYTVVSPCQLCLLYCQTYLLSFIYVPIPTNTKYKSGILIKDKLKELNFKVSFKIWMPEICTVARIKGTSTVFKENFFLSKSTVLDLLWMLEIVSCKNAGKILGNVLIPPCLTSCKVQSHEIGSGCLLGAVDFYGTTQYTGNPPPLQSVS